MKSVKKQVFFDNFVFQIFEEVYEPAEDSFLIAEQLVQIVKEDDAVLDIGTGCGILAVIAAKKAKKVIATDINPNAIECAKLNAENNHVAAKIEIRQSDLFQAIQKTEKFNLIIFNAPYLPTKNEEETWIERAWAGGPTGRQIIDRFIIEAPHHLKTKGKILLVQSNLADINKTLEKFQTDLKVKVIAEKKVAFETIAVIEATK